MRQCGNFFGRFVFAAVAVDAAHIHINVAISFHSIHAAICTDNQPIPYNNDPSRPCATRAHPNNQAHAHRVTGRRTDMYCIAHDTRHDTRTIHHQEASDPTNVRKFQWAERVEVSSAKLGSAPRVPSALASGMAISAGGGGATLADRAWLGVGVEGEVCSVLIGDSSCDTAVSWRTSISKLDVAGYGPRYAVVGRGCPGSPHVQR
jgi:hypothetical protein